MAKIDQLIQQAQDALNKAKDDEKPVAKAKLDALKEVKAQKIEMDNDEVNGLVARKQGDVGTKWKDLLGMEYEEAEKLFEQMDDETISALLDPGGEGDDEKPVIERVQNALKERDTRISTLEGTISDVNGRYSRDKVEVAIERALLGAKLDDKFLGPAKRLAGYDDLVEKVKQGQPVSAEEIAEKVNSVKSLSDVWFKTEGDEDEQDGGGKTVAGYRIKEEAVSPGIPATPQGGGSSEITDADRAARAASVY